MILITSFLFSSCNILHNHTLGEWQWNGNGHFRECPCGYTHAESSSKHIDEDRDEVCDICRYSMKYEINSLQDLSWYLLYYYTLNEYEYLDENNMKSHSIHDMNFQNTLTYNESTVRVKFNEPYFNEYLTALPEHAEYVKSNADYYSRHVGSEYSQYKVPLDYYYLFSTQETIRYGLSDQCCDYQRFCETTSKFKEVHDFYETTSLSKLTKKIYKDPVCYDNHTLSFKNEIMNSVAGEIAHLIRYYLNVEFTDHGDIVLPDVSYFNRVDIKTKNSIVYFSIEKNDGKTFWGDDQRYTINGTIDLTTHTLSYNMNESYYFDEEIMYYLDYDYNLILTNDPIDIDFDISGDFEEVYVENH
jgi:hypothetical protein